MQVQECRGAAGAAGARVHLGCEPLWVPGEHGRLADVVEATVEHDDTLEAHPRTPVGGHAQLEAVDVALDGVHRDTAQLGTLWAGGRGEGRGR